jgi:hypothetical protein
MGHKIQNLLLLLSMLTWMMVGCTANPPVQETPMATSTNEMPYPPPLQEPTRDPNVKPFQLTKPIYEGATDIVGSGTPGVPIILLNTTRMGEFIGATTIGQDGDFTIPVTGLEKGERIGLGLGVLTDTKWEQTDFTSPSYFGDEAQLIPQVGFFYDTAMVLEKK